MLKRGPHTIPIIKHLYDDVFFSSYFSLTRSFSHEYHFFSDNLYLLFLISWALKEIPFSVNGSSLILLFLSQPPHHTLGPWHTWESGRGLFPGDRGTDRSPELELPDFLPVKQQGRAGKILEGTHELEEEGFFVCLTSSKQSSTLPRSAQQTSILPFVFCVDFSFWMTS